VKPWPLAEESLHFIFNFELATPVPKGISLLLDGMSITLGGLFLETKNYLKKVLPPRFIPALMVRPGIKTFELPAELTILLAMTIRCVVLFHTLQIYDFKIHFRLGLKSFRSEKNSRRKATPGSA
jgi:hypothetical protein